MKKCAVFCGSRAGNHPAYLEAAKTLGKAMAKRNTELIYGGASVGIMAAVADAVLENGGRATGVLPRFLGDREIAHEKLTELHMVDTMSERKQMMAKLSDGFISLPGGIGTMEEYFEMLTLGYLSQHQGKSGLLNVNGYYTPLMTFFDHMQEQGFIDQKTREGMIVKEDPERLLDIIFPE
ncbi:TIGR00730 family Rossman fold protein [Alteribacter aurantiacus]|uniref:LOG family protein n=1 Tax=Alteribacter aurantiacus TaxID=254410 RepID=UPI00040F054F|nr:TIGR00730 family Rossman fold protein [Alteribacter aurantiacus]